jgi:hypothetical protein
MLRFPFEVGFAEVRADLDHYVALVIASLESDFLTLPRGSGFVDYPPFESGYEALKRATSGFTEVTPATVLPAVLQTPIALIVLRAMLGVTPPEWAYVATVRTRVDVPQGFARGLDRRVRLHPLQALPGTPATRGRVGALVQAACELLEAGAPQVPPDRIHRLDKLDTKEGLVSLRAAAGLGTAYPRLLYERFLGRPFAGHKDSVSDLIGGDLESRIEAALSGAGIRYRKTRRAERVPGFDQAPDFIIPDESDPRVVIEAKIAEDDGTARDKVTRIMNLATQSEKRYDVVACIGGRGFGIRREDVRRLLEATQGKLFTLKQLDKLVEFTRLRDFRTVEPPAPTPPSAGPETGTG